MTVDMLAQFRSALGRTYSVERELGRGGMAAVYLRLAPTHRGRAARTNQRAGQPQAR